MLKIMHPSSETVDLGIQEVKPQRFQVLDTVLLLRVHYRYLIGSIAYQNDDSDISLINCFESNSRYFDNAAAFAKL